MSLHLCDMPNLVIANGATATTTPITSYLDDAYAVTITAPAALTGTITINVSTDGGTTYVDATSGGSDVTVAAGNAVQISPFPYNALKVTSGGAEGAERTFTVQKQIWVG